MKLKLVFKEFSFKFVRQEAWFITLVSVAFCILLLRGILSGNILPQSGFAIGGFIFFGACLLVGIWQLLQKKSKRVAVNLNGWKY
ncbi:MAG: hypothetical protein LBU62_01745, partial [Bacteroidales bacterium]|nr:hypothetical protein [Bacteroidales bacterium]